MFYLADVLEDDNFRNTNKIHPTFSKIMTDAKYIDVDLLACVSFTEINKSSYMGDLRFASSLSGQTPLFLVLLLEEFHVRSITLLQIRCSVQTCFMWRHDSDAEDLKKLSQTKRLRAKRNTISNRREPFSSSYLAFNWNGSHVVKFYSERESRERKTLCEYYRQLSMVQHSKHYSFLHRPHSRWYSIQYENGNMIDYKFWLKNTDINGFSNLRW